MHQNQNGEKERKNRKSKEKTKQKRAKRIETNGLTAKEINNFLENSFSFMGTIEMISFQKMIVKAKYYSFVINCSEHWFAIYSTPKCFEIFDPLGFLKTKGCVSKNLLKFIARQVGHKKLKASPSLQSETSAICGVYCVYFIRRRDQGFTFEQILKKFTTETENEKLMSKFLYKIA